jgi:bifunctional DNA-binding transcriptional regulator/antitoxin component of YhaV-PrlF toxin-antitoxin module
VIGDVTKTERKLSRSGHCLLRHKRQTTVPKRPCAEAGLKVGDRMRVQADGPGRMVFERIESSEPFSSPAPPRAAASSAR